MPSLVRQNRGHHPPRNSLYTSPNPYRPPGTHLTYRERLQIFSLYRFGRWRYCTIASSLKLPYSTVYKAIQSCSETPRKHPGRRPILDTPIRRRLVARATINAFHRRLPLEEIAQMEGIEACRRTLITAFEKEQYHRCVVTEKPLLTEAYKQARLAWALLHRNWPP
jgi:hypothetical protein